MVVAGVIALVSCSQDLSPRDRDPPRVLVRACCASRLCRINVTELLERANPLSKV